MTCQVIAAVSTNIFSWCFVCVKDIFNTIQSEVAFYIAVKISAIRRRNQQNKFAPVGSVVEDLLAPTWRNRDMIHVQASLRKCKIYEKCSSYDIS